jgi:hypothetical protein
MSKYADYRANGPMVIERHSELRPGYDDLLEEHDRHFDLVRAICKGDDPGSSAPLFRCDFVLLSVLNRSLDLVDGFLWSFNRWNLSTAAPIARMQVDNLLRLALLSKAGPSAAVEILLSGRPLSKERDPLASPGKKFMLTDRRLREHAHDRFPWLDLVYEKSSGWIHFVNAGRKLTPFRRLKTDPPLGTTGHVGWSFGQRRHLLDGRALLRCRPHRAPSLGRGLSTCSCRPLG